MSCKDCNTITLPVSTLAGPSGADGADGAAGATIASASVTNGALTLTMSDGSTIAVSGSVQGATGAAGSVNFYNANRSIAEAKGGGLVTTSITVTQAQLTGAGLTMSSFYDFSYHIYQITLLSGGLSVTYAPVQDAIVKGSCTGVSVDDTSGDITFTVNQAGIYKIVIIG